MPNFDPIIEKITDYVQSFEAKENSLLEAKTCFFDSLACSFLALKYDQVQKFCSIEYIKNSTGSSRVIGTDIKSNPVEAAFLNGALIRWLDFNDTWLAKEWGHPSDNLAAILSMYDYLKVERNKNFSFKWKTPSERNFNELKNPDLNNGDDRNNLQAFKSEIIQRVTLPINICAFGLLIVVLILSQKFYRIENLKTNIKVLAIILLQMAFFVLCSNLANKNENCEFLNILPCIVNFALAIKILNNNVKKV